MKIVQDGTDSSEDFAELLKLKLQQEMIQDSTAASAADGAAILALPLTIKELKASIDDMTIICLGCAADGTMTSKYRKFLKSLRSGEDRTVDKKHQFGVILLGGARCMNSAASTRSLVFGSGRKLTPALVTAGATIMLLPCYELNAELDDLDESAVTIAKHINKYCIRQRAKKQKAEEREVVTEKPQQLRVVSLLGGATETLFRLGCGSMLVGRSHECDWPPCILDDPKIPEVSRSLINVDSSAYEIDNAVRSIAFVSEPAYILDQAVIEEIKPGLIIAQDQCRICAVSKTSLESCEIIGAKQLILKPTSLDDVIDDIGRIAEAVDVAERGRTLMKIMRSRLDTVRMNSNPYSDAPSLAQSEVTPASPPGATSANNERPKVALLEWCSPLMGCGYWLGELADVAGGSALFCSANTPTLSNIDVLAKAKPDVVIFALCGFDIPRATAELLNAFSAEEWQRLTASVGRVKPNDKASPDAGEEAIYVIDGNALCNRSGPRIVESAEALSEAIGGYHRRGLFGHYGTDKLLSWTDAVRQHNIRQQKEQFIDISLSQSMESVNVSSPNNDKSKTTEMSKFGDSTAVVSTVSNQLKYLAAADLNAAYGLNTPDNRARFASTARFESILRSRPEFVALIGPFTDSRKIPVMVGEVNFLMEKQYATQLVEIDMPVTGSTDGSTQAIQLQWTLGWVPDSNMYMTERVGFAPIT